jgi:hypothetical protein
VVPLEARMMAINRKIVGLTELGKHMRDFILYKLIHGTKTNFIGIIKNYQPEKIFMLLLPLNGIFSMLQAYSSISDDERHVPLKKY